MISRREIILRHMLMKEMVLCLIILALSVAVTTHLSPLTIVGRLKLTLFSANCKEV